MWYHFMEICYDKWGKISWRRAYHVDCVYDKICSCLAFPANLFHWGQGVMVHWV
jgi:hypothetical protein